MNDSNDLSGSINIRDFGAVGDGRDVTVAIRNAISALEIGGAVFFPPGEYRTEVITVPSHVTFLGHAGWSYRDCGSTVLRPLHNDQSCLFDMRGKEGVRLVGLGLSGLYKASGSNQSAEAGDNHVMHGVIISRNNTEQNIVIDDCRIEKFSGSGIYLREAHVWAVRHSILMDNRLDGIDAQNSYDFWINDCQIVANGRAGLSGDVLASGTITANRIEHNGRAGILAGPKYPEHLQITGNMFCSNYGPAVEISGEKAMDTGGVMGTGIALTGNMFRFNGRRPDGDFRRDCHVRFSTVCGVTMTGNTLTSTRFACRTPSYALILQGLQDAVVMGNAMYQGATEKLILDEGEHQNLVLRDNPGRLLSKENSLFEEI